MAGKDIIMASQRELKRLHIVQKVLEGTLRRTKAAEILLLSIRQIGRIARRVQAEGPEGIVHRSRGRESNRKLPKEAKDRILELYRKNYEGFGPTLAKEKLLERDGISISDETLRRWLIESGQWKKKRKGKQHRQWRPRKERYGEMLQVDGSHHDWFEGRGPVSVLMGYIDDATSKVYGRFYDYEGTIPAMDSFRRYCRKYGLPMSLYMDKHTTYKSTGKASTPQIVSDGSGGAIIVWEDYRNGADYNIYAQRIDSHGDALWTANGVAICTASGHQWYPQLASDGSGGAVITWQDDRAGTNVHHIYAQRINASGNVMWTPDGVAVCTAGGNQSGPQIVSDYSGRAIITWTDTCTSTYGDIYAQRVDASGTTVWTSNGVAICTYANVLKGNQVIATDGSGGAIIAWQDNRNYSYYSIYAQRVDEDGNRLWTGNGIPVSTTDTSANRMFPAIAYDGSNGVVIAWRQGFDPNWNVYAQRVIINSSPYWTSGGAVVSAAGNGVMTPPRVTDDGSQGAIITWEDTRNGNLNLYAQRIAANGTAQWTANGVTINGAAIISYAYMYPQIAGDGSGGAVITWQDYRNGTDHDIYAQRIDGSGAVQWTVNGVGVATAATSQASPQLISNGSNGVIITWQDGRGGNNDIYAQKVLFNGTLPVINLPTVDIAAITDISYTTATSGGNVTSDGGAAVTGRGVCWSTSANPAITDSCTHDGTGALICELYHRPYAKHPLSCQGVCHKCIGNGV